MKDHHKALFIAAALIGFGACSAQAAHKDVKHCADDYRKFCHAWGLETKGLENCMRKHGDKLTNSCIAALVNRERSRKPKSIVGKKHSAAKGSQLYPRGASQNQSAPVCRCHAA